ncbi:MAG: PepSY domain-containing protein [Acidiferrobacterales bacterium]
MFSFNKYRKPLFIPFTVALLLSIPMLAQPAAAASFQLAAAEISISQAVDIVRQKTGGHILSAKRVNAAEPIYVIKVLLPSGQVKSYRVSVKTGKIL